MLCTEVTFILRKHSQSQADQSSYSTWPNLERIIKEISLYVPKSSQLRVTVVGLYIDGLTTQEPTSDMLMLWA